MRKGSRWTSALGALALVGCGGSWEYSGYEERPSATAKREDIPVGTELGFGLERPGDELVVVATSTRMCRRAWFGSVDTVWRYRKSGLFGTKTRQEIKPGVWYEAWDGERMPCPGGATTPLAERTVTLEGHFDALGTEHAYWSQTTDADGRARFDAGAEGTLSWVAAFCGHGTLQVHATPLPREFARVGEPADTPTDPKVGEQGGLVTELVAPMVVPAVDSVQWRYASRCRYGGVAADPNVSAQALALAGADAERAMALDACFVGVTSACRPACAAGDPLGCQLECQNGGGAGCNDAGVAVWASDKVRAARYFAKGCQAGDSTSCENLAGAVERGETGRAADPVAVLALHQKACTAGNAAGCQAVATAAASGASTASQCDEAYLTTGEATCRQGHDYCQGVNCYGNRCVVICGPNQPMPCWPECVLPCWPECEVDTATTQRDTSTPDPPEVTQVVTPLVDEWHREEEITAEQISAEQPECPPDQCHCWAQAVEKRGGWTGSIRPAC